jgi:hypothetical protein
MGMIKKTVTGDAEALKYVKSVTDENKLQRPTGGTSYPNAQGRSAGPAGPSSVKPYASPLPDYRIQGNMEMSNLNLVKDILGKKMQEDADTTGGHNMKTPNKVYSIAKGKSKF